MTEETRRLRGRPISHEEALISAHRLINSHFHNKDRARIQIPASPWDDDLMIVDYIEEQSESHLASPSITTPVLCQCGHDQLFHYFACMGCFHAFDGMKCSCKRFEPYP